MNRGLSRFLVARKPDIIDAFVNGNYAPAIDMTDEMHNTVVCALYKFTELDHYKSLRDPIYSQLSQCGLRGTILLAKEGFNGTIAGKREGMDCFLEWLNQQTGLDNIDIKVSYTETPPFKRTKVKLKREIVTMGIANIDPNHSAGTYVEPEEWNAMIDDPEVLVVDTRNEYEIRVGTFPKALNPHISNFREFPGFAQQSLNSDKHKKIAMFCTGGIRCEKSTAFLKQQGFDQIYHLKGGILRYLEKIPEHDSRWQGECFVFDERVTVDHQLKKGKYDQCHACRMPVTETDKQGSKYQPGVSCPTCFDQRSDADKARYAEREKQVTLAEKKGHQHIGPIS